MAFKSVFVTVVFALVLFLLVIRDADGSVGYGRFYGKAASLDIQNRKVLGGAEWKKKGLMGGLRGSAGTDNGEDLAARELRMVPSGPDPLHHNGGTPKKPRTP